MDAVDGIIDRLYDGVTDAGAWARGLTDICDLSGAHHLLSMVQDSANGTFPLVATVRVEPTALDRFGAFAAEGIAMIRRFAEGQSFDFQDVIPRDQLLRSDLFNDVFRPMGGYRALMAVPLRQNQHDSFIALCRPAEAEDFGAGEAAMLDRVVPHLARAMRVKLRIDDAARRLTAALGAFDQLAAGVAIVDADLRPVVLNRRAEEIMARGDALVVSRHQLGARTPIDTGWLRRLVGRALVDDPRVAGCHTLRLERVPPRPPWSITARRLPPEAGMGGRLVVLMIEEVERQPADVVPIMATTFGLTAREAALAAELVNGCNLATAAHRLGIGIGTARNHLKAIFRKTGTHRQAELTALLLRTTRLG